MVVKIKTADEILNASKCGDIFSQGDEKVVKAEYRQMARAYHPDICTLPNASKVFAKLNELHEAAIALLEKGEWEVSNLFEIRDNAGRKYSTRYLKSFPFELGTAYIADLSLTYLFDKEHVSFFENALRQIKGLMCDSSPFQVTQFESDIRIAEQLTKLYFEQGGGGNGFESYPLAWYFAANHTSIDCFEKRGKKGFLFTMGDDCFPKKLTKREIKDIFGDEISEDISVEALLAQVNRKYEVFHLILDRWGDSSRMDKWRELMGERAIKVSDYTKIPEVIVSILETMGGKDVDEVAASWDGTTSIVVKDALSGLKSVTAQSDLVKF